MRHFLVGIALLLALTLATWQQAEHLKNRPTMLKLGPVPHAALLKAVAGEHRVAMAFRTVTRVMFYFGSFFEESANRLQVLPEYFNMYKHLENSVRLDPYNMDAYYFSQAAFTWEIGRAKDVNGMLDYGMKYRIWDYNLPFYAGFNAAFFLKDYAAAARYMQIAAERSGSALFTNLAARFFNEAGEYDLGLAFLDTMSKETKSERVKEIYRLRKEALLAVRQIEEALAAYKMRKGELPRNLNVLVKSGHLSALPADPYGGDFFLDDTGRVRSTSKFTLRHQIVKPQTKQQSFDE